MLWFGLRKRIKQLECEHGSCKIKLVPSYPIGYCYAVLCSDCGKVLFSQFDTKKTFLFYANRLKDEAERIESIFKSKKKGWK